MLRIRREVGGITWRSIQRVAVHSTQRRRDRRGSAAFYATDGPVMEGDEKPERVILTRRRGDAEEEAEKRRRQREDERGDSGGWCPSARSGRVSEEKNRKKSGCHSRRRSSCNQLSFAEDFFERCAVGGDVVGQTGGGAGGLHILEAIAGNQRDRAGAAWHAAFGHRSEELRVGEESR